MSNEMVASNIVGIKWIEGNQLVHYESDRGYGVRKGRSFLAFNGVKPSVWDRKSTAAEIASTIVDDGSLVWVEVL